MKKTNLILLALVLLSNISIGQRFPSGHLFDLDKSNIKNVIAYPFTGPTGITDPEFDGAYLTPVNSPATAAQWHFAGNNTTFTSSGDRSWDWIYSVVSTDKKEYIACGYTTAAGNGTGRSGVIFKLDHLGKLVWSRAVTSATYGGSTLTPPATSNLWQITKAADGYVAVGYWGRKLMIVEVDENGAFQNGTPRVLDFPITTAPTMMMSNIAASTINWGSNTFPTGGGGSRGNSVAIVPGTNSINNIIVGGQCAFTDVANSKNYDFAYLATLNYSGGTWSFGNRLICGDVYFNVQCYHPDDFGGNRVMKILTKTTASGYNIYACGVKSGPDDHATFCGVSNLSGTDNIQTFDKDVWLFSLPGDFSTTNFNYAYNKNTIKLDGTAGVGPNISTVNTTTYPYQEFGPVSARNFNPANGYIKDNYGGTTYESPATFYLNSTNNKVEEGHDMIFTADGNLAIVCAVNLIGANAVNNGKVAGNSIMGSVVIGGTTWSGVALGWGKEYEDCDGFLLKCDMNGVLLGAKNVGHFSGKVFQLTLRQDIEGHYILAGSSADDYGSGDPYNLPPPLTNTSRAFIVATDDNFPGPNIMRRCYAASDLRAAADVNPTNSHDNQEYDFCVFGMDLCADQGYVIVGNNEINNDDFTATKFAPLHQKLLLNSPTYETFGAPFVPSFYLVSGSETWNSDKFIASKVVVPYGATLTITNCNISFAASDHLYDYWQAANAYSASGIGCGIVVEPGGTLIIDGATLKGISIPGEHNMWDGIVAEGNPLSSTVAFQGQVNISNSSVIQDARFGLYVGENYRTYAKDASSTSGSTNLVAVTYSSRYNGYSSLGGAIVNASNSLFENCRFGVNFQSAPINTGSSTFSSCQFISDATGMGDICYYTDVNGSLLPANTHFAAWNRRSIFLYGNTFDCSTTFGQDSRPTGVIANTTSITISDYCTHPSLFGCLSGYVSGNTFSNLSNGAVTEFPVGIGPMVKIMNNTFINNFYGVNAQGGTNNFAMTGNNFKIPNGIYGGHLPAGASMAGVVGYDVSNNTFDKYTAGGAYPNFQNYGIVINDGVTHNEVLKNNTFEEVGYASVALGMNGFGWPSGLQFKCNNYHSNFYGILRSSVFESGLIAPCLINPKQGSCVPGLSTSPAGNQFYNCHDFLTGSKITTLDAHTVQQVDYYNNASASIFDPGGCIKLYNNGVTPSPLILTNTACASNANQQQACPTPYKYVRNPNGFDNASVDLATIGGMIAQNQDPDLTGPLYAERDMIISYMARFYCDSGYYDSAAALLTNYELFRDALPFYIMAGDFQGAGEVLSRVPLDSLEDSLFVWQAQLAIDLYSQGKTWMDIDSNTADSLAHIIQYNKASGYSAGAVSALIGVGEVTWPIPVITDSTIFDSTSGDSSGNGQRMALGSQSDGPRKTIKTIGSDYSFKVHPNPTYGQIAIQSAESGKFIICNMVGQQVAEYEINAGQVDISLPSNQAAGIYIGRFRPAKGMNSKEVKIIYQP